MSVEFCGQCGSPISDGAKFCSSCGAVMTTDAYTENCSTQQKEIKLTVKKSVKRTVFKIVKNSLILLVATLMFVFSFLPITSVKTNYYAVNSNVDLDMSVSCIDSIVFMFSSFGSYTSDELQATGLYDELSAIGDEVKEFVVQNEDLSEKEQIERMRPQIEKALKITMRISLMSENSKAPIALYASAIFSFMYLIFSLAFFVIALFNLLDSLSVLRVGKLLHSWALGMLAATPAMILALFSTMVHTFSSSGTAVSLSGTQVCALILSFAVIAFVSVERMVFTKNKNVRVFVVRGVISMLALAVILSTLAPIGVATINEQFSGASSKVSVNIDYNVSGVNTFSTFTDEQFEEFDNTFNADKQTQKNYYESLYESFKALTIKNARAEDGKTVNNTVIAILFGVNCYKSVVGVFSLIPLVYIIVLALASVVLWQSVNYLVSGKESKAWYLVSRVCLTVFAVAALAMTITFVVLVGMFESAHLPAGYSFGIGAASILVTVFSVIMISLPTFKNKKWVDEDDTYAIVVESDSPATESIANEQTAPAAEQPREASVASIFEDLKLLKELLDMGALTQEEFDTKKAKILNG